MDLNFTLSRNIAAEQNPPAPGHLFQRSLVAGGQILGMADGLRAAVYIDLLSALLWIALRDWIEVATALVVLRDAAVLVSGDALLHSISLALNAWQADGVTIADLAPAVSLLAAGRGRKKLGAMGVPDGQAMPCEVTDADWQVSLFGGNCHADRVGSLGRHGGVIFERRAIERLFRPARGSTTSADRVRIGRALRTIAQDQREAREDRAAYQPVVKARWAEQVMSDYAAQGKNIGRRILCEIWDEVRKDYPEISSRAGKNKRRLRNKHISNEHTDFMAIIERPGKAA